MTLNELKVKYPATYLSIHGMVKSLDVNNKLSEELVNRMSDSLTLLVHDATLKFIKGHQEHGGDIRNRNLQAEIRCEVIDMLWYTSAQLWPPVSH